MFKKLISNVIDLIYTQKCLGCGCSKNGEILCKTCEKDLKFSTVYAQSVYESVEIYSAFEYGGKLKKLIQQLKFNHKKGTAKILAKLLYEYFLKIGCRENLIIIPVPSHKQRVLRRGYCQTNLICEEFSQLLNIKTETKILKKIKNTKPQYKLSIEKRRKNLAGSFALNLENYSGENILLVDDITTTGATLEEIINLFKKENIHSLTALTVCKTSFQQGC